MMATVLSPDLIPRWWRGGRQPSASPRVQSVRVFHGIYSGSVSLGTAGSLWQHLTFVGSKLIPRGTGNEQVACCTQMANMIKIVIIFNKIFSNQVVFYKISSCLR